MNCLDSDALVCWLLNEVHKVHAAEWKIITEEPPHDKTNKMSVRPAKTQTWAAAQSDQSLRCTLSG